MFISGDAPLKQCIDRLQKGEIDTFIEDASVYANYCGTKGCGFLDKIIMPAGGCGERDLLYIAFSPANPKSKQYAAALSAELVELRKSGALQKILAKYYVKDWE